MQPAQSNSVSLVCLKIGCIRGEAMYFLILLEQILFWGGLSVFLVSLAMYAGRTKDYKSLLMFWQPTIEFSPKEFKINRAGMTMMIVGLVLRLAVNFIA